YVIDRDVNVAEGLDEVRRIIDSGIQGAVLWDIPSNERNSLLKYLYGKKIRIYMMPKISDVIVKGSVSMHLFDTPVIMTRDYALTTGERFVKRALDVTCALILTVVTSPIMLVTALAVKLCDKGPVFYRQTRCTLRMKEFSIIKFRSMRVDAEKDGVARLAAEHDDRITPVGRFIRKCRIDELPQLINVLRGDMSFIGPRPERPEIIAQYVESMPEFTYRTRVKAGLAGYAQIYGKYNTTPYDKLKLDLTYIQNYSIFLDLKLALLTLKILVTPESTEGVEAGQVTALKEEKEQP
ncbi:MAG: exopolysaccharide biosynthesis polyprenyl glycosylphosphotransferase, partial [Lachnospiraceae bacterium]|nr:exopolysaccharide biosynthesis polyprenyl glycosylphosphotransferase [Lachnospiraceae bacterium]